MGRQSGPPCCRLTGSILKGKGKGGSVASLAQIATRRDGKTVLRENRTFERRSIAAAWIGKREEALAKLGALEKVPADGQKCKDVTLGDAIDRHIEDSAKGMGRTKVQVLESIKDYDIAGKPCASIGSADLVAFAKEKLKAGVAPQTVANDLSHLSAIFTLAGPAWNYPPDVKAMREAMIACKLLGLMRNSRQWSGGRRSRSRTS